MDGAEAGLKCGGSAFLSFGAAENRESSVREVPRGSERWIGANERNERILKWILKGTV